MAGLWQVPVDPTGCRRFGLITLVGVDSGLAFLIAGAVIYSLGLGPVFTLANDVVLGNAPPERAGAAASISETGAELGGALGIAILGSVGTSVYRSQVADAIPAGLSSDAALAARGTLGGAVAVAEQLSGDAGASLLMSAREAFTHAVQVTAAVSAAIVVITAVIAVIILQRAERSIPTLKGGLGEAQR